MNPKGVMRTLLSLTLMLMLVNYVETMVIPALPKIEDQFSTTATTVAWVTSAYLIVGAVASPIFGKLGDRYGKKKVYLISIGFYSLAVLMAGFSPNIYFLIFSRGVQGIGYSTFPLAIAIITDLFPKERVAWAQGILSATLAAGPALGLLVGSYIVQDLGWPYAFHTAFILSLILLGISAKYIVEIPEKTREKIDYLGATFLMLTVVPLLVYLSNGPNVGWTTLSQIALIVVSVVAFPIFLIVERRTSEPLMRLDLFRVRNLMVANVAGLISGTGMFLMFTGLVYYLQLPRPYGLGLTIIESGLLMAPVALVMMTLGPIVGRAINVIGPKPLLVVGSSVSMLGYFLLDTFRYSEYEVLFDVIVTAAGLVNLIIPLVNMVALALPEEQRGIGIGMNTLIRTIGSAIGPVISTVFMDTYVTWLLYDVNGQFIPVAQVPDYSAFHYMYMVAIALMFLSLIASLFTKNYVIKARQEVKREVVEAKHPG
ncbi:MULTISPECIES: MFS transporter [Metallosphaera]|nr:MULTISPECIES: MFS transporter [Metallosphaera]AKV74134.1 MFS transporter [Metallosphaera sedula]AKV76374.1 MFS transporter [Metallosphaera sedula]AKV78625.1 MFS transporter [Metallosphaera sedula]AKV80870.1 MFS transporter [Metallosphaera sedula]AKV83115.1 MFS transporter [Metallosphaera sedula]